MGLYLTLFCDINVMEDPLDYYHVICCHVRQSCKGGIILNNMDFVFIPGYLFGMGGSGKFI